MTTIKTFQTARSLLEVEAANVAGNGLIPITVIRTGCRSSIDDSYVAGFSDLKSALEILRTTINAEQAGVANMKAEISAVDAEQVQGSQAKTVKLSITTRFSDGTTQTVTFALGEGLSPDQLTFVQQLFTTWANSIVIE